MNHYAISCAVTLLANLSLVAAATSADFPNRPVRMIVPFAPGGFTDIVGRIMGSQLTEAWGKPVIIDNRPGAGGTIAPAIAAQANADGYTLLFGSNSTFAVNPAVYKTLPYNVSRDLELVGLAAYSPHALIVRSGIPANTVAELVALAKKQPGKLTFASSGTGALIHMAGELFKYRAGIDILHVPFKGGGPAATAMLGGEVDLMLNDPGSYLAHIKSGRLKVLAVASSRRFTLFPDLPTFAEAGIPGVESSSWAGVALPINAPRTIVRTISDAMGRALKSPDYKERLSGLGMEALLLTTAEAGVFIKQELEKWAAVAKLANVQLQ